MALILFLGTLLSICRAQICLNHGENYGEESKNVESLTSLCGKDFLDANATAVYTFSPDIDGVDGWASRASWALTLFNNETTSQLTQWYDTGGANYRNDLVLGYDVCYLSIVGIDAQAQYKGQVDDGTCRTTFDEKCINELSTLASDRAESLVGYPHGNLTHWKLPQVCGDIRDTLNANFPEHCRQFFNPRSPTYVLDAIPLTGYNNTSENGRCSKSSCTMNGTYQALSGWSLPIGGNNNQAFHRSVKHNGTFADIAYDAWTWTIVPSLLVFMPIADAHRPVSPWPSTNLSCIRIDHFNRGSRVSPALPPPSQKGLTSGQIAGIAVGSVLGFLLVAGVLFWIWYRRRRSRKSVPAEANGQQELAADRPVTEAVTVERKELGPNGERMEMDAEQKTYELEAGDPAAVELGQSNSYARGKEKEKG